MPREALRLGGHPSAVPAARRFVHERLVAWEAGRLADEAGLLATELLTNAMQHGAPPLSLAVGFDGGVVRLEVHDTGRALPLRPRMEASAMTGRGLALVDTLAADWGVETDETGKTVWAELTEDSVDACLPAEVDLALLADEDEPPRPDGGGPPRFTVELGDVPTDLLLAAKSHVDSLAREFSLAAAGARTGMGVPVPAHVAALLDAVVSEFEEARHAIKRQALAAAAHGAPRTTLTLTLPFEAAAAGERYLAALDEADSYARAARLLTLGAPPQHRVFRRWYVGSLVSALRHAATGGPSPDLPSFESFLLGEIDTLDALRRIAHRGARLQRVTEALAAVIAPGAVGAVVLHEALGELGASRALLLLAGERGLRLTAHVRYPEAVLRRITEAMNDTELPVTVAIGTAQPVYVESREDRDRRYPALAALMPDVVAMAAVPLVTTGRPFGAIGVGFAEPRLFDEDERSFLVALAAAAAQALERSELYDARRRLADRLAALQKATGPTGPQGAQSPRGRSPRGAPMDSDTFPPDDVPVADFLEQQTPVDRDPTLDDDSPADAASRSVGDANEADVMEQSLPVTGDDEEPHEQVDSRRD